jgi:spore germination protein GerM
MLCAGCGIPNDDAAKAIDDDDLPRSLVRSETTAEQTPTSEAGQPVFLFYIDGVRLVVVAEEMPPDPSLRAVINRLAKGPSDLVAAQGFRSALSAGEAIASVSLERGVALVDLSESFAQTPVSDQVLGLGQIVLTATSRPGVGQVRFTLEGQPVEVPRADGSSGTDAVSRDDYIELLDRPGE